MVEAYDGTPIGRTTVTGGGRVGVGPVGDRPASRPPVRHLFSGLLRCGECGGAMMIVGGRGDSRTYGCATRRKRTAFCQNRLTVSKAKVERSLPAGLQEALSTKDLVHRMTQRVSQRLREGRPGAEQELRQLEHALAKLDAEVDRLSEAIALGGGSARPGADRQAP